MALNVLFGSRILPRAALRVAPGVARLLVASSPLVAAPAARAAAPAVFGGARAYGTRSVWNVRSGWAGIFFWFVLCTTVAGVMQEVVGPYVIFHE
mmetsp:Transcript_59949/g.172037  ORF Transcript_59949/g.172037 Transcript_59949/m.172037 type:complete len:95 (-) Transcript_59949:83-367(-)